jgi:hypothetical protein
LCLLTSLSEELNPINDEPSSENATAASSRARGMHEIDEPKYEKNAKNNPK